MRRWLAAAALLGACAAPDPGAPALLDLPAHAPAPVIPADNPLTAEAIELGRHLFYDARLSADASVSCSSCHRQELAFADDRAVSVGARGARGVLNAPGLANAAYAYPLTWAHPDSTSLEEQLVRPLFASAPAEMGLAGAEEIVLARLRADPVYAPLFAAAFGDDAIDLVRVRLALASFVRSLVSFDAPFDRYLLGDDGALGERARRGADLFYSERVGCSVCHAGVTFSAAVRTGASGQRPPSPYHNIGLYSIGPEGAYPAEAPGLVAHTGIDRDRGRFRVPSLRNVAVTAPYMHDGSVATLEDVIAIYERGGRAIEAGPHAGDGRDSPWKSQALRRFELTDAERADLLAFLRSLTDSTLTTDPRLASPW